MTRMHETREQVLKKPHILRCTRPPRFNVLKRTPQLIELRAPYLGGLFEHLHFKNRNDF